MRLLKKIAAVVVVMVTAVAVVRIVTPRMRCEIEKTRIKSDVNRTMHASAYLRAVRGRELAAACRRCLARYPGDYHLQFLLAMSERLMGQDRNAEKSLLRAIELNERPEFYTHLGVLQFELGDAENARRNILTGAEFSLRHIEMVSQPLHDEIMRTVFEQHERYRAAVKPR